MWRTIVFMSCMLLIVGQAVGAVSTTVSASPTELGFADPKLYQQVTAALAQQGLDPSQDALSEVRELSLANCGITSGFRAVDQLEYT